MMLIIRGAAWIGGLYLLVLGGLTAGQRYLIYFPDPQRVAPREIGLTGVDERLITTPDGVRVVAWHGPARPGQPTILYFHGNGANLAARAERIRFLMEHGLGVYMMSWRGYSGSGGSPSEAANVADARLAYADLTGLGVRPRDIVLYGESLGTGVATRIAVEHETAGLILDAPYTSLTDIGAARYPWLPVRLLMRDRYDTMAIIGQVRVPLLVIHGEADRVIPVEMGRAVLAAATQARPKRLLTIPGAGHSNHTRYGSFDAVLEFARATRSANGG